ncbi:MAG: hypothetical protein ACRD2A_05330, partial [Vicinamibacterales bacterium]
MQHVLTNLIVDELARVTASRPKAQIPTKLVARHVASTFVLVLNWWVESDSPLSPADVDAHFRVLVASSLRELVSHAG